MVLTFPSTDFNPENLLRSIQSQTNAPMPSPKSLEDATGGVTFVLFSLIDIHLGESHIRSATRYTRCDKYPQAGRCDKYPLELTGRC